MSKVFRSSVITLCTVLAACADGTTNPTVTATSLRPLSLESSADLVGGFTLDGPFDLVLPTGGPAALMAGADIAAAQQVASSSRASGHVGFNFSAPTLGLADEQYSFTALSTDPSTLAAKGQYELILTSATSGAVQKFHGEVICMSVVGNTARIAGQITKVWVNNVAVPIRPNASHNIWTVTDNGEGQGTDLASPMIFFPAPGAQFHCATGFLPPLFPVLQGNVQVQP